LATNFSRTSAIYAAIQAALLIAFSAAYFLDTSQTLFQSRAARITGGLLCLLGGLLMLAAFIVIRRSIQIEPAPRADAELVTHGIYGWFRHPIYTALLLLVLGLFLRRPTLLVAISSGLVIAYLLIKVRIEERMLLAHYPDYAAYRKRTFGLLPWLRG
jgi:protein-S-isoprenylcysteine O-methyltransferase Ste14